MSNSLLQTIRHITMNSDSSTRRIADAHLLSNDPRIRRACLEAVTRLEYTSRELDVVSLLTDPDKWNRVQALRALIAINYKNLPVVVQSLLEDHEALVRLEAIYAIKALNLAGRIHVPEELWLDDARVWESRGQQISKVIHNVLGDYDGNRLKPPITSAFVSEDLLELLQELDNEEPRDTKDKPEDITFGDSDAGDDPLTEEELIDFYEEENLFDLEDIAPPAPEPAAANLPDWLDSDNDDEIDMPDWLKDTLDDSTASDNDLPDWLASESDLPPAEIPDWLKETMDDANNEMPEVSFGDVADSDRGEVDTTADEFAELASESDFPVEATPEDILFGDIDFEDDEYAEYDGTEEDEEEEEDDDSPIEAEIPDWLREGAEGDSGKIELDIFDDEDDDTSLALGGLGDYKPEGLSDEEWAQLKQLEQKPAPPKIVQTEFSVYAAPQVQASERAYLHAYAHTDLTTDDIQQDVQRLRGDFSGNVPEPRSARQPAGIAIGTDITLVPECDDLTFEPATLTKKWHGDWTRYSFEFRPDEILVDQILLIRVSVRIKGIEIAHINTSCEVIDGAIQNDILFDAMPVGDTPSDNPLFQAIARGDLAAETSKPYNSIFISYSRRDQEIALKRAREIEEIMGANVFIDVKSLRAGDDWQYELAKAIDNADVFHLLWSEHSAKSQYCRYEWDYALNKKCPETLCVGVIRPVYWQKPIPGPPPELSHLHFEFVDMT